MSAFEWLYSKDIYDWVDHGCLANLEKMCDALCELDPTLEVWADACELIDEINAFIDNLNKQINKFGPVFEDVELYCDKETTKEAVLETIRKYKHNWIEDK